MFDEIFEHDIKCRFPGPCGLVDGRDAAKAEVDIFCAIFGNTSIFFPADGFVIDVETGALAAEVQFRSTRLSSGVTEVVNDVWISRTRFAQGKTTMLDMKEYLDGRVSRLQGQNVLQSEYGEQNLFLAPWPPFVEGRENCCAITANTCDYICTERP